MTKPVLYTVHLSPPCRTVELCIEALGLEVEQKIVNVLAGEHLKPEFLKMNPQHTIPVLDDNGTIVCESHAIMIYLVRKYGKDDSLYPKDLAQQAKVNAALFFESSFLFARMRAIFEPILTSGVAEIPADKAEHMQKAYQLLEDTLVDDYVVGNSLTIADLCCASTISTVMGLVPMDLDKYPRIYAWLNHLKTLPFYEEANGGGAVQMAQLVLAAAEKNALKKG